MIWMFLLVLLLLALRRDNNRRVQDGGRSFTQEQWNAMFPDGNRNAGGAQFFDWIEANAQSEEEFWHLNRSYCAVSGSLVDPNSAPHPIHIKQHGSADRKTGLYWMCCWPCVCDLEEYAETEPYRVERLGIDVDVLTIPDPCVGGSFPREVTSWRCTGASNYRKSASGRAIVGVLHPIDADAPAPSNDQMCAARRATYPEPRGGMGDIFVKLAVRDAGLRNVYGDPLEPCREIFGDESGSWDRDGKCSELGGGVHQICIRMPGDFSSTTGQSNWSQGRSHTTHCACLGAWALYVAKNKTAELDCTAIPENALGTEYVGKWSTWNGRELPNQIRDGVQELKEQCLSQQADPQKREHLLSRVRELEAAFS